MRLYATDVRVIHTDPKTGLSTILTAPSLTFGTKEEKAELVVPGAHGSITFSSPCSSAEPAPVSKQLTATVLMEPAEGMPGVLVIQDEQGHCSVPLSFTERKP